MHAVTFDPDSDSFTLRRCPIPRPGPQDVLIRVKACGLNPVDAKIIQWKQHALGMDASWVPGLDVSGEVDEVGDQVTNVTVGDRVLCHGDMFRPHGGFAEYTLQASSAVIPHPDVAAAIAAATPCAGWTAWRALHDKLRAKEHDAIFITGGSGGVGGFALQLAKHFGLSTIITTCSEKNHAYARKLGATHTLDYRMENLTEGIQVITNGTGVPIGLDTVGAGNDKLVADVLAFEGQMVSLVDVVQPETYRDAFMRGLSFHQLSLGAGHRNGPAAQAVLRDAGIEFSRLIEKKSINVPQLETISLDEVGNRLQGIIQQRTVGKIVMKIDNQAGD